MTPDTRPSRLGAARTMLNAVLLLGVASACAPATAREGITRNGEGPSFYRSIEVPAGAETLYLSGHVPPALDEAGATPALKFGTTEQQAAGTLASIKKSVEEAGWSMGDIVSVRVYLVADPATGKMDFAGFNKAYSQFFGTAEQPQKPVRAVVEIKDLARPGWLVEIEATAARVPAR